MQTLKITTPNETIELIPTSREHLKELRDKLIALSKLWIQSEFATGECLVDDNAWALMKEAIALLPRADNPATSWNDLDLIANDPQQIEHLFFCQAKSVEWLPPYQVGKKTEGGYYKFDPAGLKPSLIVDLHLFNAMSIFRAAA